MVLTSELLKGQSQAKIIKKSVILFLIFVLRIYQLGYRPRPI